MTQIEISNFQSIAHTRLDFNGFCTITGKSDIGKSATRRAISAVLFNEWNKSYLRKGSTETQVTFKRNDTEVTMLKSSTKNQFTLNGKEFNKMGRDSLDLPNYNSELNITTQLESLYMVSYKDAENTRILNQLFGVDVLEKAQALCASDLRQAKSHFKQLEFDLDTQSKQLSKAESTYNEYKALYERFEAAQLSHSLLSDYLATLSLETVHKSRLDILTRLTQFLDQYKLLTQYLDTYHSREQVIKNGKAVTAKLKQLQSISFTHSQATLLQRFLATTNRVIQLSDTLNKAIPSPINTVILLELFNLPQINDYETKYNHLTQELNIVENELKSLPRCPTCGQFQLGGQQ